MVGEGSQKLEPWSSLHDFQATQQVRVSMQVGWAEFPQQPSLLT